MHPFEKAGFGKAPYRCTGVTENRFVMPGFGWKPGGSCCYCGTGILYEYHVESSDGCKFHVGCDCAEKIGLQDVIRPVRLELARKKREAGAKRRREERAAAWAAEKAKRVGESRVIWESANDALAEYLKAYQGDNRFLHSMKAALAEWGSLTEGMTAAAQRTMDAEHARIAQAASSKPLGTVGSKVDVQARVEALVRLADNTYVYPPQPRFLIKLVTDDGNVLVWITGSRTLDVGDQGKVRATVKDHRQYQGVWQTVVQRVAMK